MKILILAAFVPIGTVHGMTAGLDANGHVWKGISLRNPMLSGLSGPEFVDRVAKEAENFDTVLIGKGCQISLSLFRRITQRCDVTYWTPDSVSGDGCGPPGRPLDVGARGMLCSRIICTGTEGARWYRKNGYSGRIAQIYQGCRHNIWKPGELPREGQHQLCFLGLNGYDGDGGRGSKIRAIREAGFPLRYGRRTFHEAAAKVYWNSAICLNFCCGDITSNRLMRVVTSGGFMLTEHNKDIEATFENGNQLVWYPFKRDSPHPEMLEQIRYYMDRPELRHEIAMRGHEWSQNWGWDQQMDKMVRFIEGEDVPADGAAGKYIVSRNK